MSGIKTLAGVVDGANRVFTAPEPFLADSFRLIWNGITYPPDDTSFGYVVSGDNAITTTNPPQANDVLQGFYEPIVAVGSPYDPTGALP